MCYLLYIFCDDFIEFSLASRSYIFEWNLPLKILETLCKLQSARHYFVPCKIKSEQGEDKHKYIWVLEQGIHTNVAKR